MTDAVDDESIFDEHGLLRRIPNWPDMFKFDHNTGKYRPTTACFSDRQTKDLELSVTLENDLLEGGDSHQTLIENFDGFGLARLSAGTPRNLDNYPQKICRNPTDEDAHHALIVGNKPKSVKKALVKNCEVVVQPKTK